VPVRSLQLAPLPAPTLELDQALSSNVAWEDLPALWGRSMSALAEPSLIGSVSVATSSFGLIFVAEMGDKTQLVCMTLAARHRHWPVLAGAIAAFLVLNTLAVIFGAALSGLIPEAVLAVAAAILFALFGIHALRGAEDEGNGAVEELGGRAIFSTTFLMILLAEMGDKTQLAVTGLATTLPPSAVWIGATLGLSSASALGVVAGRRLLRRISTQRLRQVSGVFFLLLGAVVLINAF
jgi:putative Ca2+/H+ antiporter (TMEM165/GDT1 family)